MPGTFDWVKMDSANNTLLRYLSTYCEVNSLGPDWQGLLKQTLETTRDQNSASEFKQQLRNCIVDHQMNLDKFEAATHWGLDTEKDVTDWLFDLWGRLYDDEP